MWKRRERVSVLRSKSLPLRQIQDGMTDELAQVSSGSSLLLAFSGSTAFSSDASPSGDAQETVFTGNSHSKAYTLAIVAS